MTNRHPLTRRLSLTMTLALSLAMLLVALLGPAATSAQTRKAACPTSAARVKAKRAGRTCAPHKHKRHKHKHADRRAKHGSSDAPVVVAALCEDGSVPVRAGEGFSCADGSEPECEDGATPTVSRNGKSLLCPLTDESEASLSEAECEEEGLLDCSGLDSGSNEQTCETSASEGSEFVCEDQSES
jgi:hypothetical protein